MAIKKVISANVRFRPIADIRVKDYGLPMSRLAKVRRLAALLPYFRARRAYVQGRNGQALMHHERVMKWSNRSLDRAFHATLLILNHRSPDARTLFREIIEEIEEDESSTPDRQYVLDYCRYYAALIDGLESEGFRVAAESATVGPLRRLLPIPPQDLAT